MVAAVVSPSTPARPRRADSPERWQAALRRALDSGIRLYQLSGTGQWIATSASKPTVAYAVTVETCECEAALLGSDPVCVHRAALRCELGLLWPDDPQPPAQAAAVAHPPRMADAIVWGDVVEPAAFFEVPAAYRCPTCEDGGAVVVASSLRPDLTFRRPCPDCAAKGAIPTGAFIATNRTHRPAA